MIEVSELNEVEVLEDLGTTWGSNYNGWVYFQKGTEMGLGFKVPDKYLFEDTLVESSPEQKFINAIRFPVFNLKTTVLFDFKKIDVVAWKKGALVFEDNKAYFKNFIAEKFPPYLDILNKFSKGSMPCKDLERALGNIVSFMNWEDSSDLPKGVTMLSSMPEVSDVSGS